VFLLFLLPVRPLVCMAPLFWWGLWWVVVWLTGLLFENYIVDASIWNTHALVCVFLQQFLMNEPGPLWSWFSRVDDAS